MINEKKAKRYCKEELSKIENYEKAIADTTQTWDLHHRTEIWWNCTAKELFENECYYNRKACELIFLTPAEHRRLHMKGDKNPMYGRTGKNNPNYGSHRTEESKKKMSEAKKGENHPLFGKHHSEETKKKMSESQKGENNHNFGKHASAETRKKMSKSQKGRTSPVKDMTWKLINGKRVYFPKEVK